MQEAQQERRNPPGVLFDTSLGDGVDQVLALAMLFHLQASRSVRVASISTGDFNLKSAAFLDAIARFYSGAIEGYGPGRRLLPIGMGTSGAEDHDARPMVAAVLDKRGPDGEPVYPHTVHGLTDTAIATAVTRNALMAYEDQNAVVVLGGSPTNLVSLLDLPGGAGWAARKVRVLSIAGGRFDGGAADPIVRGDVPGFRRLLAEWPSPIVLAGAELNALTFPGSHVDEISGGMPDHPIVDAYRAAGSTPYNAPTRALAAMLYAIRPDENYFELSEPGTVSLLDDGTTRFTPSPQGRHRYLSLGSGEEERVLEAYTTLLTAPPEDER